MWRDTRRYAAGNDDQSNSNPVTQYTCLAEIITARNEVGARLYFHRHLSFC